MCLTDTLNDPLARRPFRTSVTLTSQDRRCVLNDGLVDSGCVGAYTVINEALVPRICEELQIEPLPLSKPKPLRGFDGKLAKRPITHCLLPNLEVHGHKESTCPMLIAPLGQHDLILGKPWMNKHGVLLDMLRDKILFVPGRCSHDGNTVSLDKDLTFVSATPRLPIPCVEDASDGDQDLSSSESDDFVLGSPRKRTLTSPKPLKSHRKSNPGNLDICEISADAFHLNAKNKANRLFSLTINETYNLPVPPPPREPRIPRNQPCICSSETKYKRCCGSHTRDESTADIREATALTPEEIKQRLPVEYHDYVDVFNRNSGTVG